MAINCNRLIMAMLVTLSDMARIPSIHMQSCIISQMIVEEKALGKVNTTRESPLKAIAIGHVV